MDPADPTSLDAILDAAWAMLRRGAADPRDDWHWPVIATAGEDGAPQARVVVLRAVDPARQRLEVHTDRRSGKAAQLARDARAQLVFHHGRRRVQLRVDARARLHFDDAVADAAWARLSPESRATYAGPLAPGTPLATADGGTAPTGDGDGRAHFVVLALDVLRFDWLQLSRPQHRRARFAFATDADQRGPDAARAEVRAHWTVP